MVHRQWAPARRTVSGRAAPGAGDQRRVPGAWHLDENRSVLQGAPQYSMGERWDSGRPGSALPIQLRRARNLYTGHHVAHDMPRGHEALTPPLLNE